VPGFDRVALGKHSQAADVASTVTEGLAVAVPVLVDFFEASPTSLAEDLLVDAEALTIAGALAELAKYTVQRPRPFVYGSTSEEVLKSSSSYLSFFSGHATITFASLSAFSMTQTLRHPSRWWVWLVTAVVGTSVAIERVLAGQHFPSDVVVGSLVGAASGVLVPLFHAVKPVGGASLGASRSPDGTVLLVVRGVW
jgi:membrane-associated phospholipid phosphatase